MATFATKAIPVIGAAIDVKSIIGDNVSMAERNRKFEESKDEIKNAVKTLEEQVSATKEA